MLNSSVSNTRGNVTPKVLPLTNLLPQVSQTVTKQLVNTITGNAHSAQSSRRHIVAYDDRDANQLN